MTGTDTEDDRREFDEFEQRARALLLQSAEELPGAVRSRLTQARYAALAAHRAPLPGFARRWIPAGAAVAAVLALLIVYGPHGAVPLENSVASGGLEDIELLSDSDAVPLNVDQDVDYDFYEWAATEAAGVTAPAVGS
jgi:ferric-dicitrate binding protein FerR (iron transport regulator)